MAHVVTYTDPQTGQAREVFAVSTWELTKMVRTDLQQMYPSVKFSVRMVNHVLSLLWRDGPAEHIIAYALEHYTGDADSNGMHLDYDATRQRTYLSSVEKITLIRLLTRGNIQAAAARVAQEYGVSLAGVDVVEVAEAAGSGDSVACWTGTEPEPRIAFGVEQEQEQEQVPLTVLIMREARLRGVDAVPPVNSR